MEDIEEMLLRSVIDELGYTIVEGLEQPRTEIVRGTGRNCLVRQPSGLTFTMRVIGSILFVDLNWREIVPAGAAYANIIDIIADNKRLCSEILDVTHQYIDLADPNAIAQTRIVCHRVTELKDAIRFHLIHVQPLNRGRSA